MSNKRYQWMQRELEGLLNVLIDSESSDLEQSIGGRIAQILEQAADDPLPPQLEDEDPPDDDFDKIFKLTELAEISTLRDNPAIKKLPNNEFLVTGSTLLYLIETHDEFKDRDELLVDIMDQLKRPGERSRPEIKDAVASMLYDLRNNPDKVREGLRQAQAYNDKQAALLELPEDPEPEDLNRFAAMDLEGDE